jgi:hypothetical protein
MGNALEVILGREKSTPRRLFECLLIDKHAFQDAVSLHLERG